MTRADPGSSISRDPASRDATAVLLPQLAVLRASGKDAGRFLQSQLTHDVESLDANSTRMAAWCDAKGRALALFRLLKDGDDYLLLAPRDLVDKLLPRLRLFVLRLKTTLNVDDTWAVAGLTGSAAARFMDTAMGIAPGGAGPGGTATEGGGTPANAPDSGIVGQLDDVLVAGLLGAERWLAVGATDAVGRLVDAARTAGCSGDESTWERAAIVAGEPAVQLQTSGEFVPQMLNLELLDGISFSKGCYPGQEIVARTQYLGRIKRRMFVLRASTTDVPPPGTPISSADGTTAGQVVGAAALSADRIGLLAVLRMDAVAGVLRLPSGAALELDRMPYSLEPAATA